MNGLLQLGFAAFLIGLVVIDRWAVAHYVQSESARTWCKAQFMFSRDPRRAVVVSSYVLAGVAILTALYGASMLLGVR